MQLRIVEGCLLARHQRFVAPLNSDGTLTGRGAFILQNLLTDPAIEHACSHMKWEYLGLELCNSDVAVFDKQDIYATAHQEGHGWSKDTWFRKPSRHGYDCYDATPVPRHLFEYLLGHGIKCGLFHQQACRNPVCAGLDARFRINSQGQVNLVRDTSKGTTIYAAFENIQPPRNGKTTVYQYIPPVSAQIKKLFTGPSNIRGNCWWR
ncbi:hypothetical protein VTK26DRAFT_7625 [Humicola hyalothermophila]